VLPLLLLAGCGSDDSGRTTTNTPAGSTSCTFSDDGSAAKPVKKPGEVASGDPVEITISTSAGDIPVTLEPDAAPCTVHSFLSLAKQGYYDDTTCHRVSTSGYFILQCGDPTGTGSGGPGYTFPDELVDDDPRLQPCTGTGVTKQCTYNTGAVAMANRGPDTNGSQFFLVYKNSVFPPNYTLFGHMDAAGVKTVAKIAAAGTADGGPDGPPQDTVTITSVE
jgi:peptidyl-prolyl cis-trans isomerase B (cyclophilin B)